MDECISEVLVAIYEYIYLDFMVLIVATHNPLETLLKKTYNVVF